MTERFVMESTLPAPTDAAFAWHCNDGAFERLTPPWDDVRIVSRTGGIENGARVTLRVKVGPFPLTWEAEHRDYEPGCSFTDVQIRGPFRSWRHRHEIGPWGEGGSRLSDTIDFELPLGALGRALGSHAMRMKLVAMFRYRHRVTIEDLAMHARFASAPRLQIAVSGASGLLASTLVPMLTAGGHRVRRLVRGAADPPRSDIAWDPLRGVLEPRALEGVDAIVHLAGEGVASGRWTSARKARIRESRVAGTRALVASLSAIERRPRTLVVASAVGFYGARDDEPLDESAAPGSGFLADVVREWESAALEAEALGVRVVLLRFGAILSPKGGMLGRLLPVFRLGLGGPVGSGAQVVSWILIDDAAALIHEALLVPSFRGAYNATAPEPVRNDAFSRSLARTLRRPAFFRAPAFALRALYGEMADAVVLTGQRVVPRRAMAEGFVFREPTLDGALTRLLGRTSMSG